MRVPDLAPIRAFLDDSHLAFGGAIGDFAARTFRPREEPADDSAARADARRMLGELGTGGWLAPIGRLDWRSCALAREALGAASPLADAVFAMQALGAVPILLSDNAAMRERWVGPAIEGKAMGAFAITEPEAGSDVGALRTTARRDGDHYVIDGGKHYISNAGIADFYVLFATTDPAAGGKGVTAFVVSADAPGLEFVRPQILSSPHPVGELRFRGCRVPAANRLGDEGRGLPLAYRTLDRLRATVGAAACGMAARALEEAVQHARSRRQFGKAIAEFQLVQEKLSRMATELTAARLLVYLAAWTADSGAERVTLQAAMAKSYATEAAQRIVDDAVQILGGAGVMASHPVDRLYRSVRALRIYEGTTEIQHLVIAGQLLQADATEAARA